MAIMDRTGLFSSGQQITATTPSTNLIDMGATSGASVFYRNDRGYGTNVPLVVAVTQPFNNLTSLTIGVQVSANEAFSAPRTVFTSQAYSLADLNSTTRYILPDEIPAGTDERYVRLIYTVAGTAPTAGRITAGTAAARQSA